MYLPPIESTTVTLVPTSIADDVTLRQTIAYYNLFLFKKYCYFNIVLQYERLVFILHLVINFFLVPVKRDYSSHNTYIVSRSQFSTSVDSTFRVTSDCYITIRLYLQKTVLTGALGRLRCALIVTTCIILHPAPMSLTAAPRRYYYDNRTNILNDLKSSFIWYFFKQVNIILFML